MNLRTIEDIKKAAAQSDHSGHWFSPGALRFFSSRIDPAVWPLPDDSGALFVTSESPGEGHDRKYTVRMCDTNGEISNVGAFMGHATMREAKNHAACHAAAIGRNAPCPYAPHMNCQDHDGE